MCGKHGVSLTSSIMNFLETWTTSTPNLSPSQGLHNCDTADPKSITIDCLRRTSLFLNTFQFNAFSRVLNTHGESSFMENHKDRILLCCILKLPMNTTSSTLFVCGCHAGDWTEGPMRAKWTWATAPGSSFMRQGPTKLPRLKLNSLCH